MFEYHVVRGDFIAPRGGGHRDRRRDLRIPSPISPTPLNLFPGHRRGGLIGLPRAYANIGFRYPVLSLVATSMWGLGALCSVLDRLRFSRFGWGWGARFLLVGGKRVRFCGCVRFLLWIFVLFPGNRCGGLIGLPRVYANLGFRYLVLSLVATSTWGLGTLCSVLDRLRFSRFCWALGRSFFIGGGKRVRFCGCGRFLLWIFVGFACDVWRRLPVMWIYRPRRTRYLVVQASSSSAAMSILASSAKTFSSSGWVRGWRGVNTVQQSS